MPKKSGKIRLPTKQKTSVKNKNPIRNASKTKTNYLPRFTSIFSQIKGLDTTTKKKIALGFYGRFSSKGRKPKIRVWIRLARILAGEKIKLKKGMAMKSNTEIMREANADNHTIRDFLKITLTTEEMKKREKLVQAGKKGVQVRELLTPEAKVSAIEFLIEQGLAPRPTGRLLKEILQKAAPSDTFVNPIAVNYKMQGHTRITNQEIAAKLKKMLRGRGKEKQIVEFLEKHRIQS